MNPKLSILVPAITERIEKLWHLLAELDAQIGDKPVEIVCVLDNRRRSIGMKRQACLDAARGDYVAFVDDDDWVRPTYVADILAAIGQSDVSVVCVPSVGTLNGENEYTVRFVPGASNEPAHKDDDGRWVDIVRPPWHTCAWRRDIAQSARFPDSNYGEDWAWCEQLQPLIRSHRETPEALHEYHYTDSGTRAGKDEA